MPDAHADARLRRRHACRQIHAKRQPAEPHGKDHQEQQTDPECRRASQKQRIPADQMVRQTVFKIPRHNAEHKPQNSGQYPRHAHQRKRVAELLRNHIRDRAVIFQRSAHIPPHKILRPVQIALRRRHILSPVGLHLRPLLRRHAHVSRRSDVRLYRINRRQRHQHKRGNADTDQQCQHFYYIFYEKAYVMPDIHSSLIYFQVHWSTLLTNDQP